MQTELEHPDENVSVPHEGKEQVLLLQPEGFAPLEVKIAMAD